MTGEKGIERCHSLVIGGLSTTEESLVKHSHVLGVAVSTGRGTRVNASGVCVEDLEVGAHDRLAGVDVQNLEVVVDRDTGLVVNQVLTNILASNVCILSQFPSLSSADS